MGRHTPPTDDIPGRLLGEQIGINAYNFALPYFEENKESEQVGIKKVYPNPIGNLREIYITNTKENDHFYLNDLLGREIPLKQSFNDNNFITKIKIPITTAGIYILHNENGESWKIIFEH